MNQLIALLLFPGIASWTVLLLVYRVLVMETRTLPPLTGWRNADGLLALLALLGALTGMLLLPWPLHPLAIPPVGELALIWFVIEVAFVMPVLPALLAPAPLARRAAIRELQLGSAGRAVVWLAIGALGAGVWQAAALGVVGRVLALLAVALALPAALGIGPFASERSIAPLGTASGLAEDTGQLGELARAACGAVLLVAVLIYAIGPLPFALPLVLVLFVLCCLGLRRLGRGLPRLVLPRALNWCLWRALPLALVGFVLTVLG